MERSTKKRGLVIVRRPVLEDKDLLCKILCLLPPLDVARVGRVNKTWRKAAQTEQVWRHKCVEAGVTQQEDETWYASFQLSSPMWRLWALKGVKTVMDRLSGVSLGTLHKSLHTCQGLQGRELATLQDMSKKISTLSALFETTERLNATGPLVSLVNVQLVSDTGFVPSSKGTTMCEVHLVLNGKWKLVHLMNRHDQYSPPCILFCSTGGTLNLDDNVRRDIFGWMGKRARNSVFALMFNTFDENSTIVWENVEQLMINLGIDGKMKKREFLLHILKVGSSYIQADMFEGLYPSGSESESGFDY